MTGDAFASRHRQTSPLSLPPRTGNRSCCFSTDGCFKGCPVICTLWDECGKTMHATSSTPLPHFPNCPCCSSLGADAPGASSDSSCYCRHRMCKAIRAKDPNQTIGMFRGVSCSLCRIPIVILISNTDTPCKFKLVLQCSRWTWRTSVG